jgi:prolyl 4-hydroxylase
MYSHSHSHRQQQQHPQQNGNQCSKSTTTTFRKPPRRQTTAGWTNDVCSRLRTTTTALRALLLLLLLLLLVVVVVGPIVILVYRYPFSSTKSGAAAGEGINIMDANANVDVGTAPVRSSETKRDPQIVHLKDSDNVTYDVRVLESPVYHSLNLEYPGIERIHDGPPAIYLVHDFLSDHEADFLINVAESCLSRSLVGGNVETAGRTSDSCYFEQYHLPGLMEKVTSLTGKPLAHCEYPQVAKYQAGQQYRQHYDGFSNRGGPTARKELTYGGNRIATVLIYLNNVAWGGETHFLWTDLKIRPTKGAALVFFPSAANGEFDVQTMHAALPAVDTKYVSQIWVRESTFTGTPRKPPKHLSPAEVAGWYYSPF